MAELSEHLAITLARARFNSCIEFLQPRKNSENGHREYSRLASAVYPPFAEVGLFGEHETNSNQR